MEKCGIRTDKGDVNRQIAAYNKLLKEIKAQQEKNKSHDWGPER